MQAQGLTPSNRHSRTILHQLRLDGV